MKISPARQLIVDAVRRHAHDNYEGGWDVIVECWSDSDIAEHTKSNRTAAGAIQNLKSGIIAAWNDRTADAKNSAF